MSKIEDSAENKYFVALCRNPVGSFKESLDKFTEILIEQVNNLVQAIDASLLEGKTGFALERIRTGDLAKLCTLLDSKIIFPARNKKSWEERRESFNKDVNTPPPEVSTDIGDAQVRKTLLDEYKIARPAQRGPISDRLSASLRNHTDELKNEMKKLMPPLDQPVDFESIVSEFDVLKQVANDSKSIHADLSSYAQKTYDSERASLQRQVAKLVSQLKGKDIKDPAQFKAYETALTKCQQTFPDCWTPEFTAELDRTSANRAQAGTEAKELSRRIQQEFTWGKARVELLVQDLKKIQNSEWIDPEISYSQTVDALKKKLPTYTADLKRAMDEGRTREVQQLLGPCQQAEQLRDHEALFTGLKTCQTGFVAHIMSRIQQKDREADVNSQGNDWKGVEDAFQLREKMEQVLTLLGETPPINEVVSNIKRNVTREVDEFKKTKESDLQIIAEFILKQKQIMATVSQQALYAHIRSELENVIRFSQTVMKVNLFNLGTTLSALGPLGAEVVGDFQEFRAAQTALLNAKTMQVRPEDVLPKFAELKLEVKESKERKVLLTDARRTALKAK